MTMAPLRERAAVPQGWQAAQASVDVVGTAGRAPRAAFGDYALPAETASGARPWWARAGRVLRNAAVGFALLTAVPVGFVALAGDNFLWSAQSANERIAEVEHLRALRVPVDAAVTPAAAGEALARLFPVAANDDFVLRVSVRKDAWPAEAMTKLAFPQGETQQWWGPQHAQIIRRAAAGLPQSEREVLQRIAEAPVWGVMDMAARASWADLVGGRFQTPFSLSARSVTMPTPRFMDVKVMGYAGVSRAAYHVSRGEYQQAEAALRTVLSIGFLLIDNGSSLLEALTGRVVVNTAREGLAELYAVSGDARLTPNGAELVRLRTPATATPAKQRKPMTFAQVRAQQLRDVRNTALPRSVRLSQLEALQWSTCGSVRESLLGPSAEVRAANTEALRSLARTAAERDYVALVTRSLEHSSSEKHGPAALLGATGAAQIVSTVTGNPQLATCARAALGMR